MKTLELFCGTKSFSKVAKVRGYETFTIDNNPKFNPDRCGDLLQIKDLYELIDKSDIVWMSPPCTTFSLASGNKHWDINRNPKTTQAIFGRLLLKLCEDIGLYCEKHNKIFFIENPNGRAVWFLPNRWLKRVWYCQYGDTRAKPTNIWTNLDITFKTCKNNNPNCNHIRAKRGSKTGTQGLKNATDRGVIPIALFEEIFDNNHLVRYGIDPEY
jgi:hypothetical protein